jgi:hypothetical protein
MIAIRLTQIDAHNRLLIDVVSLCEGPQALLTMLYRSTHRLCRAGVPVENP